MDWRTARQLTVIFIAVLVVGGILFFLTYGYFHQPASCTDNKKNQGEEEVDCGGPCEPCAFKHQKPAEVFFARVLPLRPGNYDVVAEIQNPNDHLAANPLAYRVHVFDDHGVEIATRENLTFAYPSDKIYIVESNFLTERKPVHASLEVIDQATLWTFTNDLRPEFQIGNKTYVVSADNEVKVTADVMSRADFGFNQVEIRVALLDNAGNVVGAAKTILDHVSPRQSRRVEFTWPQAPQDLVAHVDIEAKANGLDKTNVFLP
ncbi:MAG: hypothetical protein HY220_00735 [Candidatus Sungbacteria bacterium]|uniref:Uncharacterized protein n=1 Tax=Candidatus Sungiibacteriota bacterium TaxID=2750080 RepID=A0A9D6QRR1_9BACT|nr:hypothetical protein [Candidatus Sungbacteria bacterium]